MKESTVQQLLGCEANGWTLPKPHHIYAKTFRHTTNLTMQNNLAKRKNSNNTSIDGPRFTIYRIAEKYSKEFIPNWTKTDFDTWDFWCATVDPA